MQLAIYPSGTASYDDFLSLPSRQSALHSRSAGDRAPRRLDDDRAGAYRCTPDTALRIMLVDDYSVIRSITRRLLSRYPGIDVVGEANNGAEALELVPQLQPDVVLMDVYMPILDGVATTRRMRMAYPQLPIVLFTSCDQDGYVLEGLRAGATCYLLKHVATDLLVSTLRAAI
jgi:CheY-like chemotaxis protein